MTSDQCRMAIALAACTFVPGVATKRFARDMAFAATHAPELHPLTDKQDKYLREAVYKFRRQIPADVVALANAHPKPVERGNPEEGAKTA